MASPIIASAILYRGAPTLCWQSEFKTGASIVWAQTGALGGSDPASTSRPRLRQVSAWFSLAGMLGPQRVRKLWLLGTFPADAELDFEFDYSESVVETKTGFGTGAARQKVEFYLPQQNCHAVRFTLRGHTRLVIGRVEVEAEKGTHRRSVTRV